MFSCNGTIKGLGDSVYRCMNPSFRITEIEVCGKAAPNVKIKQQQYTCTACKKVYTLEELKAAQNKEL